MVYDGIDISEFVRIQGGGKEGAVKAGEKLGLHVTTIYQKIRETQYDDPIKRKSISVWMGSNGYILIEKTASCSKNISDNKRKKLVKEWLDE